MHWSREQKIRNGLQRYKGTHLFSLQNRPKQISTPEELAKAFKAVSNIAFASGFQRVSFSVAGARDWMSKFNANEADLYKIFESTQDLCEQMIGTKVWGYQLIDGSECFSFKISDHREVNNILEQVFSS